MHVENEKLIQEIVATLVREAAPEAVILFGSHARHEERPDSDVDLLIIERQPFGPQHSRRKETARLYLALRNLPISKDLLLYSQDEFEQFKASPHHIIGQAAQQGRILYART